MRESLKRLPWLAAAWLFAANCGAAEVAGVQLPDTVAVAGGTPLVLNGAGLRSRLIFDVYVMGLYVTKKTTSAEEAISGAGAKRVSIRMLRDVSADTFTEALLDGIRANHTEAQAKVLDARVRELADLMRAIKEVKQGMRVELDWVPGSGTLLTIEGVMRGKRIAGEDFFQGLLRIWLGEHPVQDDLKRALLGKAA